MYKISNQNLNRMKKITLLLFLLLCTFSLQAAVSVPKFFADHMVLQRNKPISIWGWAKANEKIKAQLHGQQIETVANAIGEWSVALQPEAAGGPYKLVVTGENKLVFTDVLVGDVWLCSGQSNMAFSVNEAQNAEVEKLAADFPNIREFTMPRAVSSLPLQDVQGGSWIAASAKTVGNFTAVGYFFAKKIHQETNVPIGLICSAWGGTVAETWISRAGFESSTEFAEMIKDMPKVDLNAVAKLFHASISKRIETIQKAPLVGTHDAAFSSAQLDDTPWPVLQEPQVWESQALGEFDGVVWLRKNITLSAADLLQPTKLNLGKIDDEDITFINGIEVGRNPNWDAIRSYTIPAGVLHEGINSIAIRVVDNGGGGGPYSDATEFTLNCGPKVYSLAGEWHYQVSAIQAEVSPNSYPSLLYNGMINPLIPYGVEGILWYQGESNASRAAQYKIAFPLLITDWRSKWKEEIPFYFVQLSSFNEANGNSNAGSYWAELRESQTAALQLPNTGMCVTTDVGMPDNIHPTNKQAVGNRLAALALAKQYDGKEVYEGPKFEQAQIENGHMELRFSHIEFGLQTPHKQAVAGFEIAGADRIFYPAIATINKDTISLSNSQVPQPVAARYNWKDDASAGNVYNSAGFPAEPFRTDSWPLVSEKATYQMVK